MRKKIIIGNWKMNKTMKETESWFQEFKKQIKNQAIACDYGIAASFTNLATMHQQNVKNFIIAAQNCHYEPQGAFTGEISLNMLAELAVTHVIIGHSERRQYFNETDALINQKILAICHNSQLVPILCCGETLSEYQTKQTNAIIKTQITAAFKSVTSVQAQKVVIAYEPVWAIGTGKTATMAEAQAACATIRKILADLYDDKTAQMIRIQYGGSVKPENIKSFLSQPDIDGALVGGASLQATDFINLIIE